MGKKFLIIFLMVTIIALPFIFQREQEKVVKADDELVIITAHQGSTRFEFTMAFREWYKKRTGRTIRLDWRKPGGASETSKFIDSHYQNAFRNYWENTLNLPWSHIVKTNYANFKLNLDHTPEDDTEAEAARRAFLNSDVRVGFDIWFGGGDYDFKIAAKQGILVPSAIVKTHPEWFREEVYPQELGGDLMWDPKFRWFGVVFTSFGIAYNKDALETLNIKKLPKRWKDLADPIFFDELGVADPTKSGGVNKLFEVIIQSQMQSLANSYEQKGYKVYSEEGKLAPWVLEEGWNDAMRTIQLIAANGRNFTDQGVKPVLDVTAGNVSVGVCLDFNARYQMQNIEGRVGESWVELILPAGETALSPDCIGIFKGSKNPKAAELFVEFVLSMEGQKLWLLNPGIPGGPWKYALRRMPLRKDFYVPEITQYSSDPENDPYGNLQGFVYHTDWTGPYSVAMRFVMKAAFIDAHRELKRAWKGILQARQEGQNEAADNALSVLQDLSPISYEKLTKEVIKIVKTGDPLNEIRLGTYLTNHFIAQYNKAYEVARGKKSEWVF